MSELVREKYSQKKNDYVTTCPNKEIEMPFYHAVSPEVAAISTSYVIFSCSNENMCLNF